MAQHTDKLTSLPLKRQTSSELQQMITDLQVEVANLKKKLDQLRRAKNTTIVKRERTTIPVTPGTTGRKSITKKSNHNSGDTDSLSDVCDEEIIAEKKDLVAGVSESVSLAEERAKHAEYTKTLLDRIDQLNNENIALVTEKENLDKLVADLNEKLIKKETEWRDKEKQLKDDLKSQWQTMYENWMEGMDSQLKELIQKQSK